MSLFLKMEDGLTVFENERQPKLFWKWKTTSILFENGRWPHLKKNEDTLDGHELEVVDEIRLLWIIIRSDMKLIYSWLNTHEICMDKL